MITHAAFGIIKGGVHECLLSKYKYRSRGRFAGFVLMMLHASSANCPSSMT